jgi:hypothetical protein
LAAARALLKVAAMKKPSKKSLALSTTTLKSLTAMAQAQGAAGTSFNTFVSWDCFTVKCSMRMTYANEGCSGACTW